MSKNKQITITAAGIIILAIIGLWFFFSSPNAPVTNLEKKSGPIVEKGQAKASESESGTASNITTESVKRKKPGNSRLITDSNGTGNSNGTATSNGAATNNGAAKTGTSNYKVTEDSERTAKTANNTGTSNGTAKTANNTGTSNYKVTKDSNKTAGSNETADDKSKAGIVTGNINILPAIDYKSLKKNKVLKKLMDARKKNRGIKKSLDMIVKSNETFHIGGSKVSMQEILKKACTERGEVFQEKIADSGEYKPIKIKEYGIYVVQPGDNIWNIHFNILKEYYAFNGIEVAPKADEPVKKGFSSGVGKILKFSEKIVIIYNLIDRKIVENINLLEPMSKLVIYNMDEIFALLGEINYDNVDGIQFDGKNIWIPATKS